jgi:hypothetical protein
MTVIDVEVEETVEAVGAARAPQALVTVAVAVAVVVETHLLSTELQPPEEYVIFIGPLEPAIAASTARSGTMQGSRRLPPPHSPRTITPTFSR